MRELEKYLKPTSIINCDNEIIQRKAHQLIKGQNNVVEKTKSLFRFVRDEIKYNPSLPRYLPEHFRASNTLSSGEGFCIPKAVLLVALSRALRIPARLGFAVIRNHFLPEKVAKMLKTNVLPDHGYAELLINGRWVKVTPALDVETCRRNRIIPVDFDGKNDAKFRSHTTDGKLHIEYLLDRGPYEDVPLEEIQDWLISVLRPKGRRIILGC